MKLSKDDLAVLAHVVVDPDAWVAHTLQTVGEDAVKAKIAKYRASYEAAKEEEGGKYRDRAKREKEAEKDIQKAAKAH